MDRIPQEPYDNEIHRGISLYPDTLEFYLSSVSFYEGLLEKDLQLVASDPDLKAIIDEKTIETLPASIELKHARFVRESIQEKLTNGQNSAIWGITVTHGWVRFVKSAVIIHIQHLRQKRDMLASRPEFSKANLEAIDQRLSALEEKIDIGYSEMQRLIQ